MSAREAAAIRRSAELRKFRIEEFDRFVSFIPWNTSSFFAAYISLILFVVLYVGHKIVYRTSFVSAAEADIDTGCSEYDDTVWSISVPTTIWGKFWAWIG